jgi:EpsI family protein
MKALRTIVLVMGMAASVAVAMHFTPKPMFAPGEKPAVSLEAMFPTSFGEWTLDRSGPAQVISPAMTAALEKIYTESLSRTYVNAKGDRVMLSLAYGADQSRSMQVHKPEVCYEAQGFKVVASAKDSAQIGALKVPVMRLVTTQGPRIEPITYWIRTGDYIVRGWLEQNTARVKNGLLHGQTPDGLLVRVSTIDDDKQHAYSVHDQFLAALAQASSTPARAMLLGHQAN